MVAGGGAPLASAKFAYSVSSTASGTEPVLAGAPPAKGSKVSFAHSGFLFICAVSSSSEPNGRPQGPQVDIPTRDNQCGTFVPPRYRESPALPEMLIGPGTVAEVPEGVNDGISHIIWNVLLCDKTARLSADDLAANKVHHILAILPNADALPAAVRDSGIPATVLAYGDQHEPTLSSAQRADFATAGALIDAEAQAADQRGSVLVFCNSGYQRSIPFLAYYLTTRHPEEAPTVARAVDLILPQVDREGYSASRDHWIAAVEKVLTA